jgi:hypothetical protein
MILRQSRERYDGSWRNIQYETSAEGVCSGELTKSRFDEDIDSYYVQREQEIDRLQQRVLSGEISPVAFFMELERLTVLDTAARLRLRQATVRQHMTPRGFQRVRVETLLAYARLFDVSVADLCQFAVLGPGLRAEVKYYHDRLVERLEVTAGG